MIPPASASAATRMPADRSRAYRYDANAASEAAASRWKKLSARTSEPLRRKYSRRWEGVAFSAGKFVVASRSPNSSPHAKRATANAPEAAHTASTRADIASSLTSLLTGPFQHARRSPLPVAARHFRSPPKAETPRTGRRRCDWCGGATMWAPILATSASPTGQIQQRDIPERATQALALFDVVRGDRGFRIHEARGTSPARFWPLRSSAPSRRPARAAVRRSVPRGRQGEQPADARADARIWGDSPIPSRTASREPAQRRDRSPHVLGLPPALGACRPCSRRSLSFVGCAEHQQCSVDEEDQPTSGAQESGCLRDPPIGVAPDAGAVLGDGEVEALVGQRNLLGAAVQQRELEAEFGLDSFAVAS